MTQELDVSEETVERARFRELMVDAARARGGGGAQFIADGHTNLWLDIAYDAIAATRTSSPETRVEGRFWLIIRKPGMVPDRKGSFPIENTAAVLREFMAANPNAFIDYLTIGPDGTPDVEHGPEVLQIVDGRSMSVGRKHNARVRDAARAALSLVREVE